MQDSLSLAEAELDRLRVEFSRVSAEKDAKRIAWEEERRSLEAKLKTREASLEQLRASVSGEKQSLEGRLRVGEEELTALRAELHTLSSSKDAARLEWEKERDALQLQMHAREGSLEQLRLECLRVTSERDSERHAREEEKKSLELRIKSKEENLEVKLKETASLRKELLDVGEQLKCVTCYEKPICTILENCGHMVFCESCAEIYETRARQALSSSSAASSSTSAVDVKCPTCNAMGPFCRRRGSKAGEKLHAFIPILR
jgi:hypothetical protein